MAIYLRGKSWYYDFVHKGQRYTGSFGQCLENSGQGGRGPEESRGD